MAIEEHSPFSLRKRFFERFVNTFLQIHPLWDILVKYDSFYEQQTTNLLRRVFLKFLWFWPRLREAEEWRDAAIGKRRDPSHFVLIDNKEHMFMDEVLASTPGLNDPILDLGCNCGRFLNYLRQWGYTNLHGVDISHAACEHMDMVFPELAKIVHFQCGTFQQYLSSQSALSMETVFTHGATVELVHPSFPLIKHICRITRSSVIFMFFETDHSYPRFWEWEFNSHGFYLAKVQRPAVAGRDISLLVFRRT